MQDFRARAAELDAKDPLARFRDEFVIADPDLIYLDGNSLGRMPKKAAAIARDVVERQWGERLIRSWGEGWYELPQRLGVKIATLIGAQPDEVLVTDSTSVNFFKLVMAALDARPGRYTIVSEDTNFPSDLYLLQGCGRLRPGIVQRTVNCQDGVTIQKESINALLDSDTALLTLTHTSFKSAFIHDMKLITAMAHEAGALTIWDLSHSVGSVPVDLNASSADMAVGCCYKYLNGGPGAPAFLFVRKELQEQLLSPIWGWFGQKHPFDFSVDYEPAPGLSRFLAGTPPVLSMACIEPGVDLLIEAGMDLIRAKSLAQTSFLIELIDARLAPLGFEVSSPRDPAIRGSHVSIRHPQALAIDRALVEEANVIPDFRTPDNIRLGVAPLYTTFAELVEAVDRIARVVESKAFERYVRMAHEVT